MARRKSPLLLRTYGDKVDVCTFRSASSGGLNDMMDDGVILTPNKILLISTKLNQLTLNAPPLPLPRLLRW